MDVQRLIVYPEHFRKGIGRSLVKHVEKLESSAGKLIVSTGAANHPAKNLYLSLGFRMTGEAKATPSTQVALFEKDPTVK